MVFESDTLSKPNFCMWNWTNACEEIWLRAGSANVKLKQNAQAQDGDGVQDFSMLYMTQVEAISPQYYFPWEVEGVQI